ncbi:MAG TPA: homoserine O-acetyltransferase [Phycisphaerae bacterium]|nr:homoserine O-acetyltransferase [Phycisphaerae bacterium]
MSDIFSGSDEARNGGTLKYVKTVTFPGEFRLERGQTLTDVKAAYETYGKLNAGRDNAILICHALTGDSHVASHDENDDSGWWEILVGPDKPIDTNRYFVICPNVLGSCRGSTGPNSIDPNTGREYAGDFPAITIGDMVELHRRVIDSLGIEKLLAVIGGSMGGHQTLEWARRYPERTGGAILMATSPRLSSQSLSFDIIGRNAIRQDPNFCDGNFYDKPKGPAVGLALARMLGHITYLSPAAMNEKFEATRNQPRDVDTIFEKEFSVGSYLAYKGDKFTGRFDANSYIVLSMAMDQFDLGATVEQLRKNLEAAKNRWLVVSFTGDWLFPAEQSKQIVHSLVLSRKPVSYCNITSECGHDAFLLEEDFDKYGRLVDGFLRSLSGEKIRDDGIEPIDYSPTSIFHRHRRLDYDRIIDFINPEDSVLDIGCGHGGLLERLQKQGNKRVAGVEISADSIIECVRWGLNVIQEDINNGLGWFSDSQFDVVVLSRTIQAVYDVEHVMDEMLRVGKRCIVSVPNFGYYKLRDMLARQGRAPEAGLLHYKWYNTPNIRVLTLRDFEEFCVAKNITIHRMVAIETETDRELPATEEHYELADIAIYEICRK